MDKSCFSLSFLRPLYKAVLSGNQIVVFHITFSEMDGNTFRMAICDEMQLREVLDMLKEAKQAKVVAEVWEQPKIASVFQVGYVPMKDGTVVAGSY